MVTTVYLRNPVNSGSQPSTSSRLTAPIQHTVIVSNLRQPFHPNLLCIFMNHCTTNYDFLSENFSFSQPAMFSTLLQDGFLLSSRGKNLSSGENLSVMRFLSLVMFRFKFLGVEWFILT